MGICGLFFCAKRIYYLSPSVNLILWDATFVGVISIRQKVQFPLLCWADISARQNTRKNTLNFLTSGWSQLTRTDIMSQIIVCHNKACRYRLPIQTAKNKNGQLFCSDKCANGCNPPVTDKNQAPTNAKSYWDLILKQKRRPPIPPAETEAWAWRKTSSINLTKTWGGYGDFSNALAPSSCALLGRIESTDTPTVSLPRLFQKLPRSNSPRSTRRAFWMSSKLSTSCTQPHLQPVCTLYIISVLQVKQKRNGRKN